MRKYKMYIFFEDVELDAMLHALGDVQRVLLSCPHSSIENIRQPETNLWRLIVTTEPATMNDACSTMHSNLNIENYLVAHA